MIRDLIRGPVRDPIRGPVRDPVRGPVRDPVRDPVCGPVQVLSTPSILGVVFFVFKSLFGNWGTKETWKICNFDPQASEPCSNIDISNVAYS